MMSGDKKKHRAMATDAFICLISQIRVSVLAAIGRTERAPRPSKSLSVFSRIHVSLFLLLVYKNLDLRITWTCAASLSRKLLGAERSVLDIVDFWVATNSALYLFQCYLRENQLTSQDATHTYNLIRTGILSLICNDRMPTDLLEVRKVYETSLKKYDWSKFLSKAGGLFNDDSEQLLTALLCVNKNDVQTLSVLIADVHGVMADGVTVSREKIRFELQRISKGVRDMLEGYCDKMCHMARKAKDQRGVEKWCLAKQSVGRIRSLVACEENEAKISEAVKNFCWRANEAGASTCACMLLELNKLSEMPRDSLAECRLRVVHFKECIEKHDGYKLFGPDTDELTLQRLFWFVWYGTSFDVNRECANGRGACDYTVSFGASDKSVIEIKLGSNSELKSNLKNQLPVYKDVNNTENGFYVVVCRKPSEVKKCQELAKEFNLKEDFDIYIIDATPKKTASKIK